MGSVEIPQDGQSRTVGEELDEIMADAMADFKQMHPDFPLIEVKIGGEREAIEGLRALIGGDKPGEVNG